MVKSTIEKILTEELAEIWALLTNEEKRKLIDNFTIHNYKKNQIIYAEKEDPEYLWALIDGKVKKYKDGVGGRVQILRLVNPGQYFGYRAFFAGEPYVSSAATIEPSTLGTLPMSLVEEMISKNNRLAMFFIHELSRKSSISPRSISADALPKP